MIGLEYIRKLNFDTVDSLAEKLHVSKGLISQWENKKAPIPNKRLEELSKLYNTPKEYFFKELNRLDKLRLQENKIVDVLSKTDEVDENDTIINTINTFSNCLDVPKMELLKNTQTIIEFEELIQKIYDISEINFTNNDSLIESMISALGANYDIIFIIKKFVSLIENDSNIFVIKKFISLMEDEKNLFILSIFKAVELSKDDGNSVEIHNELVNKLIPIFRDWRLKEKERTDIEYQEYKELFGLDDE